MTLGQELRLIQVSLRRLEQQWRARKAELRRKAPSQVTYTALGVALAVIACVFAASVGYSGLGDTVGLYGAQAGLLCCVIHLEAVRRQLVRERPLRDAHHREWTAAQFAYALRRQELLARRAELERVLGPASRELRTAA